MEGVLLIDKPSGWTSFDVVNYIRKIIANDLDLKPKNVKVGHIGTLDPLATGLLVLLIGKSYTTKATELSKLDKIYEVELKLGFKSPSMDTETKLEAVSDLVPTKEVLNEAILSFRGKIDQTPPIYSAIKVNGQRAYDLARQGKDVELKARPVEIYDISLDSYDYPMVKLTAHVSSGTYIRSLVNDIGEKLGSGAFMTALKRTKIGEYKLDKAASMNGIDADSIKRKLLKI